MLSITKLLNILTQVIAQCYIKNVLLYEVLLPFPSRRLLVHHLHRRQDALQRRLCEFHPSNLKINLKKHITSVQLIVVQTLLIKKHIKIALLKDFLQQAVLFL